MKCFRETAEPINEISNLKLGIDQRNHGLQDYDFVRFKRINEKKFIYISSNIISVKCCYILLTLK